MENTQKLRAIERFMLRLEKYKGRTVRITLTVGEDGQPEFGAIENIGRTERFDRGHPVEHTEKPA